MLRLWTLNRIYSKKNSWAKRKSSFIVIKIKFMDPTVRLRIFELFAQSHHSFGQMRFIQFRTNVFFENRYYPFGWMPCSFFKCFSNGPWFYWMVDYWLLDNIHLWMSFKLAGPIETPTKFTSNQFVLTNSF